MLYLVNKNFEIVFVNKKGKKWPQLLNRQRISTKKKK